MSKNNTRPAPEPITMRRSTSGVLAVPALPAHLVLRRAQAEESSELAALLGRAYPDEIWEPAETRQGLFCDETVRAPLVVVVDGRLLATASLQVPADFPEIGRLRWVATELDRRREGIAQALVVSVLNIAADISCKEVHLKTTTDLLGAIALYLKLGFEPLIETEDERVVWDGVFKQLG